MPLLYGLPWVISDYFIKHAVHRIRPYLTLHLMPVGFIIPHSYSFPSGHTLSSFLAATILSYLAPQYTKWFYLLAFLIGLSRLYCEVHYLSDVMVGALLGIIAGYLSVYVLKIINHKKMIVKNETK
jgi:undecaprenyl-diphosphatase